MEQRYRGNGTIRSNADTRHDAVAGAIEIRDRGDHAQIDLTGIEQPRTNGRYVESQRDAFGRPIQPVDERPDIQIVDRAEPDRRLYFGHS